LVLIHHVLKPDDIRLNSIDIIIRRDKLCLYFLSRHEFHSSLQFHKLLLQILHIIQFLILQYKAIPYPQLIRVDGESLMIEFNCLIILFHFRVDITFCEIGYWIIDIDIDTFLYLLEGFFVFVETHIGTTD
jgi:hypothetical protein